MIKDLGKLPKRKVTVNELLGQTKAAEDAKDVSSRVMQASQFILITIDKDQKWKYRTCGTLTYGEAVYYLEQLKMRFITGEDTDE